MTGLDFTPSTEGGKALAFEYSLTGDGDEWGDCMGWLFAVAHVLHHSSTEPVPASWQYRDGLGCSGLDSDESYEESILIELWDSGTIDEYDLIEFGNALDVLSDALRAEGLSY